jgi:hypothetical protein
LTEINWNMAPYFEAVPEPNVLYIWGKGSKGRLGNGNNENSFVPQLLQIEGHAIVDAICGSDCTFVIAG